MKTYTKENTIAQPTSSKRKLKQTLPLKNNSCGGSKTTNYAAEVTTGKIKT
jgi:hypothetical protein